jgi:hypothetical protein
MVLDGIDNPHPDRYAGMVAILSKLIDPSCTIGVGIVAAP